MTVLAELTSSVGMLPRAIVSTRFCRKRRMLSAIITGGMATPNLTLVTKFPTLRKHEFYPHLMV